MPNKVYGAFGTNLIGNAQAISTGNGLVRCMLKLPRVNSSGIHLTTTWQITPEENNKITNETIQKQKITSFSFIPL